MVSATTTLHTQAAVQYRTVRAETVKTTIGIRFDATPANPLIPLWVQDHPACSPLPPFIQCEAARPAN